MMAYPACVYRPLRCPTAFESGDEIRCAYWLEQNDGLGGRCSCSKDAGPQCRGCLWTQLPVGSVGP